jgi:hypothetical protein
VRVFTAKLTYHSSTPSSTRVLVEARSWIRKSMLRPPKGTAAWTTIISAIWVYFYNAIVGKPKIVCR